MSDEVRRWARPRYAEYKAGKVAEDVMCGEMVSMHRGLREEVVQQASNEVIKTVSASAVKASILPWP